MVTLMIGRWAICTFGYLHIYFGHFGLHAVLGQAREGFDLCSIVHIFKQYVSTGNITGEKAYRGLTCVFGERKKLFTCRISVFLQPHAHHFNKWRNPKLDRPAASGYDCYPLKGQPLFSGEF